MFLLYRLLWWLLLPIISLYRFYKDWRSPLEWRFFGERFAFGNLPKADLLIHAVSLGEVRAVTPLVKAIQKKYPHLSILFTTTTLTGRQQIRETFEDTVLLHFLPLDLDLVIKRFLTKVKPRVILVMETEIWPNFIYQSQQQKIPFFIISACLSDRSYKRYQKLGKYFRALLSEVRVLAQSDTDASRFRSLGVKSAEVMGNIKFDLTPSRHLDDTIRLLKSHKKNALFWVFASSHDTEEEGAIQSFLRIKPEIPNLNLILAPRHPERFQAVESLLIQHTLSYQKRSSTPLEAFSSAHDVWLIDSIGELLNFYAICDVATVGGSFVPIGGHNILEPAFFAKPIVVGPYMAENREIMEVFVHNKAIISTDFTHLSEVIISLCHNEEERIRLGLNAKKCIEQSKGGVSIVLERLSDYFS